MQACFPFAAVGAVPWNNPHGPGIYAAIAFIAADVTALQYHRSAHGTRPGNGRLSPIADTTGIPADEC
jgi:hypothetical protein